MHSGECFDTGGRTFGGGSKNRVTLQVFDSVAGLEPLCSDDMSLKQESYLLANEPDDSHEQGGPQPSPALSDRSLDRNTDRRRPSDATDVDFRHQQHPSRHVMHTQPHPHSNQPHQVAPHPQSQPHPQSTSHVQGHVLHALSMPMVPPLYPGEQSPRTPITLFPPHSGTVTITISTPPQISMLTNNGPVSSLTFPPTGAGDAPRSYYVVFCPTDSCPAGNHLLKFHVSLSGCFDKIFLPQVFIRVDDNTTASASPQNVPPAAQPVPTGGHHRHASSFGQPISIKDDVDDDLDIPIQIASRSKRSLEHLEEERPTGAFRREIADHKTFHMAVRYRKELSIASLMLLLFFYSQVSKLQSLISCNPTLSFKLRIVP